MATVGITGMSVWCNRRPKASRNEYPAHDRKDSSECDCSRWRSSSADEDAATAWNSYYTETERKNN